MYHFNSSYQYIDQHNFSDQEANHAILQQISSNESEKVVINLSSTPYINSLGINFLIHIKKKMSRSGGSVHLVKPSNAILKVLELTRLKSMFNIHQSLEEFIPPNNEIT